MVSADQLSGESLYRDVQHQRAGKFGRGGHRQGLRACAGSAQSAGAEQERPGRCAAVGSADGVQLPRGSAGDAGDICSGKPARGAGECAGHEHSGVRARGSGGVRIRLRGITGQCFHGVQRHVWRDATAGSGDCAVARRHAVVLLRAGTPAHRKAAVGPQGELPSAGAPGGGAMVGKRGAAGNAKRRVDRGRAGAVLGSYVRAAARRTGGIQEGPRGMRGGYAGV